jgi:hypothetical protein
MTKMVGSIIFSILTGLLIFIIVIFAVINVVIHVGDRDTSAMTDTQVEAMMDVDASLDPAFMDTEQVFCITFYSPDNPAYDPLGGGRTCSDGSTYFRDSAKPATENLFLKTFDGRTIQGSLAVPLGEYYPTVPLGSSPAIKLQIPGYNKSMPAEVHDHFGHVRSSSGGWFECTAPDRLDVAISGPEEQQLVEKYWRDNNLIIGERSQDPNPMNRGTLVTCQIITPDLPSDVNIPDFDNLSPYRQLLLKLLLSKLNCPYIWGAAGPNSFDCSGLVMWAYRTIGNRRPGDAHWTGEQCNAGDRISAAQVLPGDAVYFGSGVPHHVGIYIGGGQFLEAHGHGSINTHPITGDVVRIRPLSSRNDINCWVRFMDPEKDVSAGTNQVQRSQQFMNRHGFSSALRAMVNYNIQSAQAHGMDFRMALICAYVESSGGNKCFHTNNPFGYGQSDFPNLEAAFDVYYQTIAGYGYGTDAYRIFLTYRGANNGYAENCVRELNTI